MGAQRNPIIRIIDGSKRGFWDKPPVPGANALVVLPKNRPPFVVPSGGHLRNADFKAASVIYEVTMGDDSFQLSNTVPSSDDAFSFQISGEVSYGIADPLKIVQRNITDTRSDVQKLVIAAITTISRDQDPDQVQAAQRAVRHQVEGEDGTAAARLQRNGYELKELTITVRREQAITDLERQRGVEAAAERLREVTREREKKEAAHLEQFLVGDLYKRLSYQATLGPRALEAALNQLSTYELETMRQEMTIMGEMVKDLEDHQQQKFFNQLKQRVEQRFTSSRMLKSEDVRGTLTDSADAQGSDKPASQEKGIDAQGEDAQ